MDRPEQGLLLGEPSTVCTPVQQSPRETWAGIIGNLLLLSTECSNALVVQIGGILAAQRQNLLVVVDLLHQPPQSSLAPRGAEEPTKLICRSAISRSRASVEKTLSRRRCQPLQQRSAPSVPLSFLVVFCLWVEGGKRRKRGEEGE